MENINKLIRIDALVAEKSGLSRGNAKEAITAGLVSVNGKTITKPGAKFIDSDEIIINAKKPDYVGRGGYKLAAALDAFNIGVAGLVCGDIGASTGGFTDCMLQRGAARVYAVDAGAGQLADGIKNDARVISMEKTNARYLYELPEKLDFISVDVSFISVTIIIDNIAALLKPGESAVCLIKPQFEAGAANLNKKGVVKDEKARENAVAKVLAAFKEKGFDVSGRIQCPITGRDGNIEYLAHLKRGAVGDEAK